MRRIIERHWYSILSALVCVIMLGCDSQSLMCVENISADCRPLYDPPTFDIIYEKTLHATCASGIGTCHTGGAAKGGLVFDDPNISYQLLLGTPGERARVIPGDAACSALIMRLESNDPEERMPPGPEPLLAAERCTIVQWIAQGAAR